jgi:hypothetical protein
LSAPEFKHAYETTVALSSPYKDNNGAFYCAATRFSILQKTQDGFIVSAYDATQKKFKEVFLPQEVCFYPDGLASEKQQREHLCSLVTRWANIPHGCIPLIWGGASIGHTCNPDDFKSDEVCIVPETYSVWSRPKPIFTAPYQGVDASSVVLRAAQVIGIPYFCKNSTTAAHVLKERPSLQMPENGDLIWLLGSLLIISNIAENKIITAMSYGAGYGRLIELPLAALFKGITTYEQLVHTQGPITLLNRDGSEARTINNFKILNLLSGDLKN